MKILLIEDDRVITLTTVRMLGIKNYEVVTAADAPAAISVARTERPDLILLDLGLPGGGGLMVLGQLRELTETGATPVVVVTGGATPDQLTALASGGVTHILTKPVRMDELIAVVEAALAETSKPPVANHRGLPDELVTWPPSR